MMGAIVGASTMLLQMSQRYSELHEWKALRSSPCNCRC